VSVNTVILQALSALLVGVLAAVLPMRRAARVSIVNGLRALG
jgi:putative ABC transport system permease protein